MQSKFIQIICDILLSCPIQTLCVLCVSAVKKKKMESETIISIETAEAKAFESAAGYALEPAREPLLKRPLDIALSLLMMMLSLPVALAIALAIKWEDGGPIFYRQERWGKAGNRFRAYKFRTMVANSDEDFGIVQAKEDDPRTTQVGKVLRAMGLDELPQIINIFMGHMSFVGPRSLAVGEIVHDLSLIHI